MATHGRILLLVTAALSLLLIPPSASAQSRSPGQEAILAFEAARADAYRSLLESVEGLRVEGATTVFQRPFPSGITAWAPRSIISASLPPFGTRSTKWTER